VLLSYRKKEDQTKIKKNPFEKGYVIDIKIVNNGF